jgi:trimeric autotransporter adhesin
MRLVLLLLLWICFVENSFAQSAAINTDGTNADASAILDVKSTNKGFLLPRMTTAQRTAIVMPALGLKVFDTDTKSFWFYSGTAWLQIATGIASPWAINGTHIYNTNTGNVGIGTSSPTRTLSVLGASSASLLIKTTETGTGNPLIDIDGVQPQLRFFNNGSLKWTLENSSVFSNDHFGIIEAGEGWRFLIQKGTGNIGIGASSGVGINPTHKLSVTGSNNLALFKNATGNAIVEIESTNGVSELRFKDNGLSRWAIRNNALFSNDFTIWEYTSSSASVSRLTINASTGNVGIGTTSPTSKLDVLGNAEISGDLTVNNGRGIVRSSNSTQLKVVRNQLSISTLTLSAGAWAETGFFDYENFGATPQVFMGNILSYSSADFMKLNIIPVEVSTTGCKFRVINVSNTTVTNLSAVYQVMVMGAE